MMPPMEMRPVYHVSYVYRHHARASGYHRLTDFIGERVELSPTVRALGETLFRLPGKLISWYGGQFEYSRQDLTMEIQTFLHMRHHRNAIYHFLYGEKSFKFLARARGFRGHRTVLTLHHPEEHYSWLFRSTDHLARADLAIVLSRGSVEFTERLVGKGRVTFVPYGVDTHYFSPLSARTPRDTLQCVFIGYHMRDFDALAEVAHSVLSARSDVEFVLISGSPQCERLANQPRVRWLKKVPDADYLRALQEADLLVLPLRNSVANTALLEAMAVGLPMVVTEGGVRDYVHSSFSRLTPKGDAAAMSEAVLDMLSSRERLTTMRLTARQHALQFDWSEIARRVREVYLALS